MRILRFSKVERWLARCGGMKLGSFTRARVSGESMAPTFNNGDILVIRIFKEVPERVELLKVVLVEREAQPGIHYIKRVQKAHGDLYWVEGDNRDPEVETRINDSRTWGYVGAHEIRGEVVLRLKRGRANVRKLR